MRLKELSDVDLIDYVDRILRLGCGMETYSEFFREVLKRYKELILIPRIKVNMAGITTESCRLCASILSSKSNEPDLFIEDVKNEPFDENYSPLRKDLREGEIRCAHCNSFISKAAF